MKKKFLVSLLLIVMIVIATSTVLVACNKDEGEKLDYTVTVVKDDMPVEGVTVKWCAGSKVKGKAVTGADGVATAQIASGTYTVLLEGYDEGLTFPEATAKPDFRKFTMRLSVAQIASTVTVINNDHNPAAGVVVNYLDSNNAIKGTATTDANGKATCNLNYGTYKITLNELPDYNVWNGTATIDSAHPDATINLVYGNTVTYNVTVKSEGGLLFKNEAVLVFDDDGNLKTSGYSDDKGVFRARLEVGNYTVEPVTLQDGYDFVPAVLSSSVTQTELILTSSPIDASLAGLGTRYVIGDIIHDYKFTTSYYDDDGVTVYFDKTISEIFAEGKKMIIINNWGLECSYCVKEMPAIQSAYEKYEKDIEIVALSNFSGIGDTEEKIFNFANNYNYTFPMMRDANGLATKFGLGQEPLAGWPVTIIIDRYGAVARIESGAILEAENWGHMIDKYIDDDYVQDFEPGTHKSESITTELAKPDVKAPEGHYQAVAETINAQFNEGTTVTYSPYTGTNSDYAWPFLLGVVDGVSENGEKVLYSTNYHRASSFAVICATVTAPAGKVFTFDYYCESESTDVFTVGWDGKVAAEISGKSNGWKTCYAYVDLADGTHDVSMSYVKDDSSNVGKDTIYIKNVRFTEVQDIVGPADMMRSAAYGTPAQNATRFPYYAGVEMGSDGYYHVKLDTLENNGYAGVDNSPLLLISMMDLTSWNVIYSINDLVYGLDPNTGDYAIDCEFEVNGVTKDWRKTLGTYLQTASSSDIEGFLPVDKELYDLIVAFMKQVNKTNGATYHEDEWLEACYFYSHYGDDGNFVGNPIIGITEKTSLELQLGAVTKANLNRMTIPYPFAIYNFTAPENGLYKIESLLANDSQNGAQAWLYDDTHDIDHAYTEDGDTRFIRDGVNEKNFTIYRYMHAGEKYYIQVAFLLQVMGDLDFKITRVSGDTATVLTPACDNLFTFNVDENGNRVGDLYLMNAIEYGIGEDGYYRVKNSNGVLGDFVYLDVKYDTMVTSKSITTLLDQKLRDPNNNNKELDYGVFDFRYMVNYITTLNSEGNPVITSYDPKAVLTSFGADYKDYTQILKDYIADPEHQGPEDGLIKVNEQIVKILTLFIEVRVNAMIDGEGELALENEWLRMCWYYKTYDENHRS
ncbi:MAG: redoxin domain-containing protein [Bacteroides sp.]|nr:redoxin domain-containing protein [Bacillota bacterium]MCM1394213.1 redoxin domain-containing protein [[Eubacterium] siraeum]MCM1455277.1 redoxin domain-containing protein [Bacteroides sp.]